MAVEGGFNDGESEGKKSQPFRDGGEMGQPLRRGGGGREESPIGREMKEESTIEGRKGTMGDVMNDVGSQRSTMGPVLSLGALWAGDIPACLRIRLHLPRLCGFPFFLEAFFWR